MIILNFKSYKEVSGLKALKAAKLAEKVSRSLKVRIAVSPQFADFSLVASKSNVEIFSQHVDPVVEGRGTGQISFHSLKEYGVNSSLLNHSERKVDFFRIKKTLLIAKKMKFNILLLADTIKEARRLVKLKPWGLGLEPPELIGTGKSVSEKEPETLKVFVKLIRKYSPKTIPFCGAGISRREDVEKALELGAEGILVASAFDKAKDKMKILKELAKPFS